MYILPGALAPLAAYRQFILVQFVPRLDKQGNPVGKMDKVPTHPQTFKNHNAHDPAIWLTWQEAARLAEMLGDGWGIGFVITAADDIICFDLDSCGDGRGGWTPHTLAMMGEFPGAMELSNSGNGLHVWATYSSIPTHGKRNKMHHMELYSQNRFIALGSSASGVMTDNTAILPGFIDKWFAPGTTDDDENDGTWTSQPTEHYTPLTDEELFTRARASVPRQDASAVFGGVAPMPSFLDLWERNVAVLARAYPPDPSSQSDINNSDADFALAKELAYWTGKDCTRIARLMNMSALKRDKWLPNVHKLYFKDTILNAVAACKAVFHIRSIVPDAPAAPGKLQPQVITHQTFIGRENLAILFNGCVYIRDMNAVLLPNGDIVDQARFKVEFAGYTFCMDDINDKVSKDAWEAFIHNSIIRFPRVEGTTFDPSLPFQAVVERAGRSWVNIYKAPIVLRKKGDAQPFIDLLNKLLPNGDDALILLSYIAAVCQYPGEKFRWAPFIQGTPGNGKSTIVSCLKFALGNKYIFSVKTGMIENNFNSWLENNVLYVADDIYSSRDRTDMMESLKSLITERDHGVTYKGIDSIQKQICGNFLFMDNHKDAMKKTDDSRRLAALYCAQQTKRDRIRDGLTKTFFTKTFIPWLKNGGYEIVAEYLHTLVIDPRYNPAGECQEAPDTSVTQEAIKDGRTGIEHEVSEWIELSEPGFCGDFVSMHMLKKKMESIPRYAKSMGHLKVKEMMLRLGYEIHRGLPDGRCAVDVLPDNTRPVLFVKVDSDVSDIKGAAEVARRYSEVQQTAMTAAIEKRFANG